VPSHYGDAANIVKAVALLRGERSDDDPLRITGYRSMLVHHIGTNAIVEPGLWVARLGVLRSKEIDPSFAERMRIGLQDSLSS
jgi:hypothetical protein